MRIGIDARLHNESGVGRYIRNLLLELGKLDKKNEYFVFLRRKYLGSLEFEKNFHPVEADFGWYGLEEQLKFPLLLYKYKLDLVHFPHFNVPLLYLKKFIVTIHDLIHQHSNMQRATTHGPIIFFFKKLGYKIAFKHALACSEQIITVSNFVKEQLIQECRVNRSKISVTYEAADDIFVSLSNRILKPDFKKVLQKFGITKNFIFYTGNAHPHKNVEGLIKCFLHLLQSHNIQLVLSGSDHYFWKNVREKYKHKNIVYTGFVSDNDLVMLYRAAKVYVVPSFEEGFGIPILEAMACGCPVVSSNAGSLPEVGGNACIYFNPKDPSDMAGKIALVLDDRDLRKELIVKGGKRYKTFSWGELARQTLKVYRSSKI